MAQPAQNITAANAPFRAVRLGPRDFTIERKADGTIYLRSPHPLPAYPAKLTERLVHWAKVTPDTTFMADRVDGAWRKIELRRCAGARRAASARRCSTATCRRSGRSRSCPATISNING